MCELAAVKSIKSAIAYLEGNVARCAKARLFKPQSGGSE
jgi:hypothetical protein